ncbi:MAG: hypothetical protein ACYCZA_07525 [Thiobacillus sp.]
MTQGVRSLGGCALMMARNTPPPAAQGDIVESELFDMLQTLIDARCGLSAIHHLLDEAKTMPEIRARFNQWQTDQSAIQSQQPPGTPDKPVNRVNRFVRR